MKDSLKKILIQLLYLTPIGYLLKLFKLQTGEYTPGLYIELSRDYPILAYIKNNPTYNERINWLVNGFLLLLQGVFIIIKNFGEDLGFTYAWIALIFGIVSTISSVFPKFNWNNPFLFRKITILELLVVISLIMSVVLKDIIKLIV